tara:strand:+ start:217 stop:1227 length:1011 start_codon:yes stop_codon:yes gene_type:complete
MTTISCAISGLTFNCSGIDNLHIPISAGYFHPLFAASSQDRQALYSRHCKGMLSPTDSYLLFLAILHASGNVEWHSHVKLNPLAQDTIVLVETNIAKLIHAIEQSAAILHPQFYQPSFRVTEHNCDLSSISAYIEELESNVADFRFGYASQKEADALQILENRLTALVLEGTHPDKCATIIAEWANKVAQFPEDKAELYIRTIKACFSPTKMFNTPASLLHEIKAYCELNIEAGSIHFHALEEVLEKGIANHLDYLGVGLAGTGGLETLPIEHKTTATISTRLPPVTTKNQAAIAAVIAKAPKTLPQPADYSSNLEFLQAKLAYRAARAQEAQEKG